MADLDEEFGQLRKAYSLPQDPNQWPATFAARVVLNNKEFRLRVKQDIENSAHNLKHLYSEGGDGDDVKTSNAMHILLSMVIGALKANRRLNALLDEYNVLHKRLLDAGLLSLADRIFVRKTLPDLERCRKQLDLDAAQVRDLFKTYKQSFYILAYERELKKCKEALSARKTTKTENMQQTGPIFKILASLLKERKAVSAEAGQLGYAHAVDWFSRGTERITLSEHERAIAQYDALRARIWTQREAHDACVNVLKDIEGTSEFAPATLPGTNGEEVPVETIRLAFNGYERICATCSEMVQLSDPIIETLEKYLVLLRGNETIARMYAA